MIGADVSSVLDVTLVLLAPLVVVVIGWRYLRDRRRGTWKPLRQTASPFGEGTRRFAIVFASVCAVVGALTLLDGVRDDQPWSAAAGLVQLVGFSVMAWVYLQMGRDLGPGDRADEDVVLLEPVPLAAFTVTLLAFFGLVTAIAAVVDGAASWWILPPAIVMVASFAVLRRSAALHGREAEET